MDSTQREFSIGDEVKGAVGGCLLSIPFIILVFGLFYCIQYLPLAWPAIGYFVATAIALLLVMKSHSLWMKAAKAMLIPAVIGFGILSVLLW